MTSESVPPKSLAMALDHLRTGGKLFIPTYTRVTVLTLRTLERFEKAGSWLLKEDGDGYRMKCGNGSVFLFPGQLKIQRTK